MRTAGIALIAAALGCGALPARAADYHAAIVAPADDSLWLGHFSGGRNLAPGVEPIPLDWVDVKENFPSYRDCAVWLKDMTRSYRTYEGWKACIRIR
ncbi:MAG: hypothetical protein KGM42_11230 [Hyphomicrobiales bacterium]|nr:hypothetical protein [Hyphomicrobiales bacterium]